jgi:hypothetical protein
MNEQPIPPNEDTPPAQEGARRYWIDEDGNVHGVVLTVEVGHVFEFNDKAVDLTPKGNDSDKSSA